MNTPAEPKKRSEPTENPFNPVGTLQPKDTLHYHSQLQLKRRTYWWLPVILLLALCLSIQLSFSFEKELRAYPAAEPWLNLVCRWLPCESQVAEDPYAALRIISREVIAHPTAAGAVQVNATLINQADTATSFPLLELSFKNIDGAVIARRRFAPTEYLADELDISLGMPPQQLIRISLDLVDPGNTAVAFEFHFISP